MKKKVKMLFVLILIVITASRYIPIKSAVHNLREEKREYILVKPQSVTGFNWYAIGDNSGEFSQSYDIILRGKVPNFEIPNPIAYADNTFVCFGEYEEDAYSAGQLAKVFRVEAWSILYPINRNGILPSWLSPKYGLTIWD